MSQVEILSPARCLADHEFQDFLASAGVLQQTEVNPADLAFLPKRSHRIRDTRERFLQQLIDNKGFVVSREALAENIWGEVSPTELQRAGNHVAILRRNLVNREAIFSKRGVGAAVGVGRFSLDVQTLPLAYHLWRRMLCYANISDLAIAGWGIDDKGTRTLALKGMQELQNVQLKGTKAEIEHQGSMYVKSARAGTVEFRLVRKQKKVRMAPELEPHLPPYLDLDFQNFLASEEVGLLRGRDAKPGQRLRLRRGAYISPGQRRFKKELAARWGYFLPYTYLSEFMNGRPDAYSAIATRIKLLKRALERPQDLYFMHGIGLVIGLDSRISARHFNPLHSLWENMGGFVSATGPRYWEFHAYIEEIEDLLRETPYQIVKGDRSYSLQRAA